MKTRKRDGILQTFKCDVLLQNLYYYKNAQTGESVSFSLLVIQPPKVMIGGSLPQKLLGHFTACLTKQRGKVNISEIKRNNYQDEAVRKQGW